MGLFNKKPKDTYKGLLKTIDEENVSTDLRQITDGDDNPTALLLSEEELRAKILSIENVNNSNVDNILTWDSVDKKVGYRNTSTIGSGDFDTGWITFQSYNPTDGYGVPPVTSNPRPLQFRIINRTVYFRGNLLLPLNDILGVAVTDYLSYRGTSSVFINQIDTGVSVAAQTANALISRLFDSVSQSPIIPSHEMRFNFRKAERYIIASNNENETIVLTAYPSVVFKTDGSVELESIFSSENRANSATFQADNPLRMLTTVADEFEYTLSFGDLVNNTYRTSWDGATNNPSINTQYKTSDVTLRYPVSVNMTKAFDWGGLEVEMDGTFFMISNTTPLSVIHNLFS